VRVPGDRGAEIFKKYGLAHVRAMVGEIETKEEATMLHFEALYSVQDHSALIC
jgi:hypothetical protein